ncbi:MAG: hypothetical protein AT710_07550 [Thermocladium sp. ECH_B]|nr:MAG: hypothetical protein AT710_07550 [Thermocladium sp. ECH_B]
MGEPPQGGVSNLIIPSPASSTYGWVFAGLRIIGQNAINISPSTRFAPMVMPLRGYCLNGSRVERSG